MSEAFRWHEVLEPNELPEGRVKSVSCGLATLCMTHFQGRFGALDNSEAVRAPG